MREGRELPHLHIRAAGEAKLLVSFAYQLLQLRLRHSILHREISGLIGSQCDLRSQAHQCDFVCALDHAATCCHWSRAGYARLGGGFGDALGEDETHSLFYPNLSSRDATFLESLRNTLVRIVILLPDAKVSLLVIRRVIL